MPRDVELIMPFPVHVNPDRIGARDRSVQWCRMHGLLRNDEEIDRYLFSQVPELAAYGYPEATGDDLDLAFDLMAWFFIFDDRFEIPPGTYSTQLVQSCEELIELLYCPPGSVLGDVTPIVGAFDDIWRRLREGMSVPWCRRVIHNWADYFEGNLTEAVDRAVLIDPDTQTYHALRRQTVGVWSSLDLAERVGHFEVPPAAWFSSLLKAMRAVANDHIAMVNEIYGLEKDEAHDDPNLVRYLARDRRLSREDAVVEACNAADTLIERFISLRQRVPHLSERLNLSSTERRAVDRHVAVMCEWIAGNHEWHTTAGRYSAEAIRSAAPDSTGFLNSSQCAF
ncbi:terpene synthase family protein [Nocardia thraciensis]